jgi:hypothetical protein
MIDHVTFDFTYSNATSKRFPVITFSYDPPSNTINLSTLFTNRFNFILPFQTTRKYLWSTLRTFLGYCYIFLYFDNNKTEVSKFTSDTVRLFEIIKQWMGNDLKN